MSICCRVSWLLGLLMAGSAGVTAGERSAHARVELLARQSAAAPGSNVEMGVHFVLEPGWHIYWVNPGDSGQPPVLKWQLPLGFSAGEIQWPRPERMQATSQLADFGYHGEVLLPVTLRSSPSAKPGSSVQIAVEAKWLVCREVCIPEHAQMQVSLPVGRDTKPSASAQLFSRAEKLLPQPLPPGWKASAKSGKDDFVLSVQAGRRIQKAEFFPLEPGQVDNAAPQRVQPLPAGARITLRKSDLLVKPISVLRGILSLPGGPAYRIEAALGQSIQ